MDFIVFDPETVQQHFGSVAFYATEAEANEYRDRLNKARKPEYATFVTRALKEV